MLIEITKVPNAGNSAIHLHPTENVAIARVALPAGTELSVEGLPVLTRDAIPAGHKVALWDIAAGETVERYGNLFDMYQHLTAENPYEVPMRIFPAMHYTMGGLWVD